jgi:hypothetical protein
VDKWFDRSLVSLATCLWRWAAAVLVEDCLTLTPASEILKEIRVVRKEVERLECLIEEWLLPISEPLPDEVRALKRYVRDKLTGRLKFERLERQG